MILAALSHRALPDPRKSIEISSFKAPAASRLSKLAMRQFLPIGAARCPSLDYHPWSAAHHYFSTKLPSQKRPYSPTLPNLFAVGSTRQLRPLALRRGYKSDSYCHSLNTSAHSKLGVLECTCCTGTRKHRDSDPETVLRSENPSIWAFCRRQSCALFKLRTAS